MNADTIALFAFLATTVFGGFCGGYFYLLCAEHGADMAQLLLKSQHHENLFKPEYDRMRAMPSEINDDQGWLAMARAATVGRTPHSNSHAFQSGFGKL